MVVVFEKKTVGGGQPGRHQPFVSDVGNLAGVGFDVTVGDERERGGFAGVVARTARAKDDGSNVAGKSDGWFAVGVCGSWCLLSRTRSGRSKKCHEHKD